MMLDVFARRTTDVTLTDLVVEGCLFVVSGTSESVIGFEKCDPKATRGLTGGTIRLDRIGFRENRFLGRSVAIQANASSCSKLEIEDFYFQKNTCNGVCGLLLAKANRLQNITIRQNRRISSLNGVNDLLLTEENRLQKLSMEHFRSIPSLSSRSVIIWAPPRSSTSAENISASENSCATIEVDGGSFGLSNSIFRKNAATDEEGDDSISACIKMKDASAVIRDCSFEENEASYGVAINARRSNITLEDCAFRGNVAGMDGTIYLRNRSSLTIDSCRFSRNRAEKSGGAIYAQNAELSVTHLTCVQNNATLKGGCLHVAGFGSVKMTDSVLKGNRARSGGALHLRNTSAAIDSSKFLSNRAEKLGGGIRSIGSNITANGIIADGNHAEYRGGSVSIASRSNLTVHDSVFKNGASSRGGAVEQSENSVGRFGNVTFVDNLVDEEGGAIFADNATVIIHNARFRNVRSGTQSYLSGRGGFLFARHHSSVFVEHATMTKVTAGNGGAIFLEDSVCTAKQLNVSKCTAVFAGGAVVVGSSEFLCTNCLFASNTVSTIGGGAIYITKNRRRRSIVQLQESKIINNSGRWGGESTKSCIDGASLLVCFVGGLHVYDSRKCLKDVYKCIAVVIIDTQFEGNSAYEAGGAIFADRLENIRFQCNSSSKNGNLKFLEEKEWSSLNRITPDTTLCPAWKNNSAGIYGEVVGTMATMAKMTVEYKGEKTEVLTGEGFEVRDYVGGNQLPTLSVEMLDELKQGPANANTIGPDGMATLTASEGFQVGSSSLSVEGQTANFPLLIGFGLPGIYNMTIRFARHECAGDHNNSAFVDPLTITVHVRNCTVGEMPVGETKICSNCSTSTYNFDPEAEECQPCPENGNCKTRVIVPNDGYWHASPCSVNITRCLTSYACKFDDRDERLTNLTRDMKNCRINATTVEEYQQTQCAEASDWSAF